MIPARKGEHRRDNRAAILRAADALLRTHAVSSLTMDEISREAGVARRTVYNHFASIADLFVASRKAMIADLVPLIPAWPARTLPANRALSQFAADTLRLLADPRHIELYLTLIREGREHPALIEIYDRALAAPLRQQLVSFFASDRDDCHSHAAEFHAALIAMAVAAHQFESGQPWHSTGVIALTEAFLARQQSSLSAAA